MYLTPERRLQLLEQISKREARIAAVLPPDVIDPEEEEEEELEEEKEEHEENGEEVEHEEDVEEEDHEEYMGDAGAADLQAGNRRSSITFDRNQWRRPSAIVSRRQRGRTPTRCSSIWMRRSRSLATRPTIRHGRHGHLRRRSLIYASVVCVVHRNSFAWFVCI